MTIMAYYVDMYSLSIGAIIAITVSSVVLLLGIVLVLFGLMKKRKSSKTTLVSIGPPVVNNPRSGYVYTGVCFANFYNVSVDQKKQKQTTSQ